jgi:hypothetical protein
MRRGDGRPLSLALGIAAPLMTAVLLLLLPSPAVAADLDCRDFGTREAANRELNRTINEYGYDIHRLDADRDGEACERSGSAMVWGGVAAAAGVLIGFGLGAAGKGETFVLAIGHAVLAAFIGLFLGWLLPGLLPRTWSVSVYALVICVIAAGIKLLSVTESQQRH